MTAVQRIADLFRPDRQRRHWPNNSHSVFVYECRLSRLDRTLCAATFLARQRLFMAGLRRPRTGRKS